MKSLEESPPRGNSDYLLGYLPILDGDFALVSQKSARELLEAFRLKMAYDKLTDLVRIEVTVEAREVDSILGLITHLVRAPKLSQSEKFLPGWWSCLCPSETRQRLRKKR